MKVLAIGAHPDDVEIFCGGTIAKYAAKGHEIVMVSVTNGEIGSKELSCEEIIKIRRKEGEAAAKVIGAEYVWMGYRDQQFMITNDARLDFINLMRRVKPDVIITHYPDYVFSADHTLVGQIVSDVSLNILPPNIKTKYPYVEKAPIIYFMDSPAGIGFEPEEYVDISDNVETKRKMIKCHESQEMWVKYHCGSSLLEEAEVVSRFRGLQINVAHAEAYIRLKGFGRGIAGTLLP
ncbi:MAG: PIG-L deacetylase family protein [Candidatus Heimdallarchaeaceae archaeon]